MKTARFLLALTLSAAPFSAFAEVAVGSSRAEVRAELGAPRGQATIDDRQILYYDRGEVELEGDRVIRVGLRSPEEQADLDAREERQRGEREERMSQLFAEGTAVRDRKLADENFRSAPLAYQVSYWETFVRMYPGVSVLEPLTIARMRLAEQRAEQQYREDQAARIADLEARLADRESSTYYGFGGYGYGYGHYGSYNPPNVFGNVRYHFGTDTGAPYETPHGSPYETPHGSPYSTPSRLVNDFPGYNTPVSRSPYAPSDYRPDRRPSNRDWRNGRGRY